MSKYKLGPPQDKNTVSICGQVIFCFGELPTPEQSIYFTDNIVGRARDTPYHSLPVATIPWLFYTPLALKVTMNMS